MPAIWTAERDQRLLLLLVEQVKVDGNAVAAAWKTNYGEWSLHGISFFGASD
jgi:hypothetical protein